MPQDRPFPVVGAVEAVGLVVSRNQDGSYEVSVSGGRVAEYPPWCTSIRFAFGENDTGCALDDGDRASQKGRGAATRHRP